MTDLIERLLEKADEIDRAVSRNKDDIESGSFNEIELLREAATEIERLQQAIVEHPDDVVVFNAIRHRRSLLKQMTEAKTELENVEKIIFDGYR